MSTIIYIIIAVIAIVMFCVFVLPKLSTQEKKEKTTQPEHFDLLDDNANPIKNSNVKIIIGGGDSDAPVQELQYFCIKDKGYHVSVWPKNHGCQGLDYIEFDIAGIAHGEHVDDHLGEFIANLIPEPTNTYDANAIKIVTENGHRIGYVPKSMTQDVRDFAKLPCKCYCYIGTNDGMYFSDCYIKN